MSAPTVEQLAAELDLPARELVKFVRFIRDDHEMRPRLRAVHPHTPLSQKQADHVRMLDELGRKLGEDDAQA